MIDGERGAAVRRRVRDLRPRQRHLPRRGAGGGAGRAADLARPERAVDGARRDRLRQGQARAGRSWSPPASIGPGATNMVTAAGVAHANRLPVLLLAGDTFANRRARSGAAAGRALRRPDDHRQRRLQGRSRRYWDRITRPEQIIASLPQAVGVDARSGRLRPGLHRPAARTCRREAFDYPERVLRADASIASRARGPTATSSPRRPTLLRDGEEAADHRRRRRALLAAPRRRSPHFAETHGIPVVETIAGTGRRCSTTTRRTPARSASSARPRPTRSPAEADVVLADRHAAAGLHHRLLDRCSPTTPGSSASTPPASTRPSTARCRWSATPAVGSRSSTRRSATGRRPKPGRRSARASYTPSGTRCVDQPPEADQRRAADLRPGRRRREPRRATPTRPRAHRRRRPARRAVQELAGQGARHLRLRVRLLLHGLRDRRRLGRARWPTRRATSIVHGRRRLLPDDELRHLFVGADRPQADRRGLRQWRLRRHQPAAERQGRPVLQQPARRHAASRASWSGSTSPSTPSRWVRSPIACHGIGELEDAFARAKAADRTTVIHVDGPRRPTGPRERRLVGVRHARGEPGARACARRARSTRRARGGSGSGCRDGRGRWSGCSRSRTGSRIRARATRATSCSTGASWR